jgi:hypothetical protein
MVAGFIAQLIDYVAATPSIETVAKALLFVVPMLAFEAFLILNFRVRTVVDGTGVTQHWITSSYHLPYEEITDVEPVHTHLRWYLRVHCGDRTFETIPCNSASFLLAAALGAPLAMRAAEADIRRRLVDSTMSGRKPTRSG